MATEHQIYLASSSPRRSELLTQIGVRFAVIAADTDESRLPDEAPEDYVRRVALDKARMARMRLPTEDARPVLAADTAVVLDQCILGKPADPEDAARMLRLLAGRTHRVLTGVALVLPTHDWTAISASRVTFRPIREDEMQRYWRTGEPLDKAGGYGIQGYGAVFVANLEGSYSGVMGLPLFETAQLLERAGILSMTTDN
ncbi:septum formation protein [Thiobaca trueperi]|uniref:dTTP/UTP pyrophosphatase n=1 Tax=Thiobaca trueperi TaxID=127458 RepID=A0A4R3MTT9_9GAMM|nr:Maf family protein [Thiobaca trueperi]TCT19860.1 septum formation protein [Thiobaca trueperi]